MPGEDARDGNLQIICRMCATLFLSVAGLIVAQAEASTVFTGYAKVVAVGTIPLRYRFNGRNPGPGRTRFHSVGPVATGNGPLFRES